MQMQNDSKAEQINQTASYPVTVHIPEKNPTQEDDDYIRMAAMLKKVMEKPPDKK